MVQRHTSLLILFALVSILLCAMQSKAAQGGTPISNWAIGFNELWIQQYVQQQGLYCPNCPGIGQPRSLSAIDCRVLDLASNRHVGAFREIVPLYVIQPNQNFSDPTNAIYRQKILDVIRIYSGYNVKLILSFGQPLPRWMSPQFNQDGNWCPWPDKSDTATFATLKNNMSWAIGNFINYLRQSGIPAAWIQNNLFVEGFNEFDDTKGRYWDSATASWQCKPDASDATPQRAASLQGGINYVLNYYGIQTHQTSPSVTGTWKGYSLPPADNAGQYLLDYYNAGGGGYPQVHFYTEDVGYLRSLLYRVNTYYLPATWKYQMVLGEAGKPEYVPNLCCLCPNPCDPNKENSCGILTSSRDWLYRDIAADPIIRSELYLLTFWRTMNLSAANSCGAFHGVVHDNNSGYKDVGNNLFVYLGGQPGPTAACPFP